MNRKTDPEDKDFEKLRKNHPWCIDHQDQLKDIWTALRGNGHPEEGLIFKVAKIEERQSEILDFVKSVKGVFWKMLPIAIGGAIAAILNLVLKVVVLLSQNGQL